MYAQCVVMSYHFIVDLCAKRSKKGYIAKRMHLWQNCAAHGALYPCIYTFCLYTYVSHSFFAEMESFSALLALCAGNSPVTSEFPTQRPVTRTMASDANNREAGDLRRHGAHYDVIIMLYAVHTSHLKYAYHHRSEKQRIY